MFAIIAKMRWVLMMMIRTILAFFGYVKVPKEAILLSMKIEETYRQLSKKLPAFITLYEAARSVTAFLRSGRLLSFRRDELHDTDHAQPGKDRKEASQ
jgi:hypothetical protein